MKSYLNDRKAIDRLKREYQEHGKLIIGLDFDNTIYDYYEEGLDLEPVIELLRKCKDLGFIMCLHSLVPQNADMTAYDKREYCEKLGIKVDFINSSPVLTDQDSFVPNKPFYSILLDDRAGLSASYNILKTTLEELGL